MRMSRTVCGICSELRMSTLQHDYWNMVDRQRALGQISRQDVMQFSVAMLSSRSFVEGLVMGNISVEVGQHLLHASSAL